MTVKKQMIEDRIRHLNKITGNRIEKYLPYKINNRLVSNKGHYYLSIYNGKYGIEQIVNTMGGCTDISYRGSKTEIYDFLNAFIKGFETAIYNN